MAPEQADGSLGAIGPQTDVYGLGVILYEMLTGRPPLWEATGAETVRRVVAEDPVPPRRLRPNISRDLEAICLKCLEKQPSRRYLTAAALADDLCASSRADPQWRAVGIVWPRRQMGSAAICGRGAVGNRHHGRAADVLDRPVVGNSASLESADSRGADASRAGTAKRLRPERCKTRPAIPLCWRHEVSLRSLEKQPH